MIPFRFFNPRRRDPDLLGHIPFMLRGNDDRPAREQINERYSHGGGWQPTEGFKLLDDNAIQYPGDPVKYPYAVAKLRDELILVYPHSWVAIVQPDDSFEIARID